MTRLATAVETYFEDLRRVRASGGVTEGALRPEIAAIAVPATVDRRNMAGDDFAVDAGWGHFGSGQAVMPGQGRIEQRAYTRAEREALNAAVPLRHSGARRNPGPDPASTLGDSTFDVYLNDRAYWRNVPAAVWNYKLGGYQVLKKWLSYRERAILGRPLLPEEVQHFTDTARRIAADLCSSANPTPARPNWPHEGAGLDNRSARDSSSSRGSPRARPSLF